jgi:hypothetical protein
VYFILVRPEELEQLPHHLLDKLADTALHAMFDERDKHEKDPQDAEQRRRYLQAREWLIACQDARRKPRPAILRIKIDRLFDPKLNEAFHDHE